jgi:hypothetical protein
MVAINLLACLKFLIARLIVATIRPRFMFRLTAKCPEMKCPASHLYDTVTYMSLTGIVLHNQSDLSFSVIMGIDVNKLTVLSYAINQ